MGLIGHFSKPGVIARAAAHVLQSGTFRSNAWKSPFEKFDAKDRHEKAPIRRGACTSVISVRRRAKDPPFPPAAGSTLADLLAANKASRRKPPLPPWAGLRCQPDTNDTKSLAGDIGEILKALRVGGTDLMQEGAASVERADL
jgi:hypothetical protein